MPPVLFVFFRITLTIQGLSWFHATFRNFFFYFFEDCHWSLDRDCIESVDIFGYYEYFKNISSSNP